MALSLLLYNLEIRFCSDAQLTSPGEAVCVGEQVVFVCQQSGSTLRWTVGNLPGGVSNELTITSSSSQAGMVLTLVDDPGFGFEIHVLSSSSSSNVITELHVTAVRQLNGVTVGCRGPIESYMSTIQIISGEFTYNNSHIHNKYSKAYLNLSEIGTHINIKLHQLLQVE